MTKLADQSFKNPKYSVSVKNSQGKSVTLADPKATRALISLMDMHAVLGGAASHYGGPAALAELMSALHGLVFTEAQQRAKPWYELFHLVNDAGHCENGLYALKAMYEMAGLTLNDLKKFRSMESPLTGHGEVHCFPKGVFLSNGPLGSAFPQSQGLAMADQLAQKSRTTVCVISDGACMEGEAREAMAAIPGLAHRGQLAPYVLIISDNNTKLTGRIDSESFSLQPTFKSLENLGWNVLRLEEGHNLQKCFETLEKAFQLAQANPKMPVAIHAKTIKGYGNKKAMDSASGGHGFPLKGSAELTEFLAGIYDGQPIPDLFKEWIEELIEKEKILKAKVIPDTGEKIQKGISSAMIKAKEKGWPVVSITSDLPGSTGVADFRKKFPQASFDVGVAESNMISVAAGFSKGGFLPVVDTFAQFGVTKGALPLTMASLSEAPVIAAFSHTGFQDAADGASHQALSYYAMSASIPHVKTIALSCSEEAEALMLQAFERQFQAQQKNQHADSYVFFLGRENFPSSFGGKNYSLEKAQVLRNPVSGSSRKVTLITAGSLVGQTLLAAEKLSSQGIECIVINYPCLNHFDEGTLKSALEQTEGRCVTVEDHQLIGGLGSFLAHQLSLKEISYQMKSLAVHGEFGRSSYQALELYQKHGLDSEAIVKAAKAFF